MGKKGGNKNKNKGKQDAKKEEPAVEEQKQEQNKQDDVAKHEEAVAQAMLDMQEADVLLLSPGCASWDQFKNYEERGRQFIQYVQLLHCANK